MKRYLVELVAKATVRQKLIVLADDDREAEQNAIRKAWAGKRRLCTPSLRC